MASFEEQRLTEASPYWSTGAAAPQRDYGCLQPPSSFSLNQLQLQCELGRGGQATVSMPALSRAAPCASASTSPALRPVTLLGALEQSSGCWRVQRAQAAACTGGKYICHLCHRVSCTASKRQQVVPATPYPAELLQPPSRSALQVACPELTLRIASGASRSQLINSLYECCFGAALLTSNSFHERSTEAGTDAEQGCGGGALRQ